jgi:hypothetical protein
MTVTDISPAQTTTDVRFAITLPAAPFLTALRNVYAVGASTDTTLPVLCGVNLEMSEDGTLTFAATDRYVLATQELTYATACAAGASSPGNPRSCSGSGSVFLPAATVKTLTAVKVAASRSYELITLTVSDAGALTVALPDTSVLTWPAADHGQFPAWRNIIKDFRPCAEGERPETCCYNPAFLARFAKVKGEISLTITPGMGSKEAKYSSISRVTCGEVTAWLMQIRLDK